MFFVFIRKSKLIKRKLIPLLICAILTEGCSTAIIKPIRDEISKETSSVELMRKNVGVEKRALPVSTVSVSDTKWLKLAPMAVDSNFVPSALKKDFFVNRDFRSVSEVAERVTLITGIPVNISPDVNSPSSASAGSSPGMPMSNPGMSAGSNSPQTSTTLFSANYRGSVAGFLDSVAARYNVSWEYRAGRIEIFLYTTKAFVINSTPGDVTSSSRVGSSGTTATASTGSVSDLSTAVALNMSVWSALESSIKTMLSSGGKMVSAPAIGSITVTDTPRVMAEVEKFIEAQNENLSKQVTVDVQVMSIDLTNSDDYGIDWTLVNDNIKSAMGLAFESASPLTVGASVMTLSALQNGSVLNDGTIVKGQTSNWQGSKMMFQALSKQGEISIVTSATAVTLNNQPVPVMVGKVTSYLASSSTTPSPTVGIAPTTTMVPGSIATGFSMNILPHIREDGKLILQYAVDLTSLTSLLNVASNGSMIQVPNIDTRKFMQRVALRSGETLVLAGFESSEKSAKTQGVGSADNAAAGGSVNGARGRNIIIVLVRPVISAKL